jgi:hypothetical protein
MVSPFETFFTLAKTYGIFEFYLPFLLVLTLFYGLLEKTKIFGEKMSRLNMIISLVAALYVMIYSPVAITITSFFSTFFTQTSIVIVTLLVGVMILGLLGGPILGGKGWEQLGKKWMGAAVFLAVLLGIGIFSASGGFQLFVETVPVLGLSAEDIVLIVLLVITILAIWYITRGESE